MIKQEYAFVEDFVQEIKLAKVQKVFYFIDFAQQPITKPAERTLPDGTTERINLNGMRMTATILMTAVTPQTLDEKQSNLERQMVLAGNPIHFVFNSVLVSRDCFDDKEYTAFGEEVKAAREGALEPVQKNTNALLISGKVGADIAE